MLTNSSQPLHSRLAHALTSLNTSLLQKEYVIDQDHIRYRFWQVEALLTSSAEILDRCIQLSDRYTALAELAFRRWLENEDDKHRIDELQYRSWRPEQKVPTDLERAGYPAPADESYLYAGTEKNRLSDQTTTQLYSEAQRNHETYYRDGEGKQNGRAPQMSDYSIAQRRWQIEKELAELRFRKENNYGAEVFAIPRELTYWNSIRGAKSLMYSEGSPLDYSAQMNFVKN